MLIIYTPIIGRPPPPQIVVINCKTPSSSSSQKLASARRPRRVIIASFLAAMAAGAPAAGGLANLEDAETLSNIPQTLSGTDCESKDCRRPKIQRPKSRKAESCTIKCVTTCIRGGDGSPGEGPLTIRRPLVVFKQGFRSRQYCLVECSDICNLIPNEDP